MNITQYIAQLNTRLKSGISLTLAATNLPRNG
jgi:hypothetical protein